MAEDIREMMLEAEDNGMDISNMVHGLVTKGAQRGYALGARDMLDSIEDEVSARYARLSRHEQGPLLEMMPFLAELRAGVNEILESTGGVE